MFQNLKRFLLGGIILLLWGNSCAQSTQQVGVMTFNIRFDNSGDGANAWLHRREAVIRMLQREKVEVIGLQEALINQLSDLKTGLPGMTWFGHGRDDGKTSGEFSAIIYDSTWFERLDGKTFWLSPTPDVPGVKGWDAACPRVVTWVLLKNRETGNQFYVINTHFDHLGETARRQSALIVSELASKLARKHPVILLGDFNASPESEVIKTIAAHSGLAEASTRVENHQPATDCTYTGFDGKDCEHIDFIWISPDIQAEGYQIIDNDNGFNRLSDHRPVKAMLTL